MNDISKSIDDSNFVFDVNKYLINDINKYTIVSEIGNGNFGLIYKVEYNGKYYAAKVLLKADCNVYREIYILMKLQHQTMIKFYGFSKKDFDGSDFLTIIMDLAENSSLEDFLMKYRENRIDPNLKYDNTARQIILIGIARGMMHLHQHNSIHRDLKPQNILLDKNLHPLISDFGLSKSFDVGDSNNNSRRVFTPLYMAPEMFDDNSEFNRKVDVYSFGIIMYEVVTGIQPFAKQRNMGFIQFGEKIIEGFRPKFDPKNPIKSSIKKLIEQCWDNDPKKRPTFEEIYKKLAFNLQDPWILNAYNKNSNNSNNNLNDSNKNSNNSNNSLNDSNKNSNDSNNNLNNSNKNSNNSNNNLNEDYYLDDIDLDRIFEYVKTIDENAYANMYIKNLTESLKSAPNASISEFVEKQEKMNNLIIELKGKIEESEIEKERMKEQITNLEGKIANLAANRQAPDKPAQESNLIRNILILIIFILLLIYIM